MVIALSLSPSLPLYEIYLLFKQLHTSDHRFLLLLSIRLRALPSSTPKSSPSFAFVSAGGRGGAYHSWSSAEEEDVQEVLFPWG